MSVHVRRPSGLLAPFEVPELTIDAAVERSWEMRGALLLLKQPELLPAFALPFDYSPFALGLGLPWGPAPPWPPPVVLGLPEL